MMMSKLKKTNSSDHNKGGVWNEVRKFLDDKLRWLAIYLVEKTRHIPPRRLAALLFMVCIGCSLILTLNIFYSFKHKKGVPFRPIRTPVIKPSPAPSMEDVVYLRVQSFHQYLDSLKRNDLLHYDSIMKLRPGLMDSIITIEQFSSK